MWICRALASALALSMTCTDLAFAEIYRFTDESGRERFVSSLDQVPPRYRAAAREAANEGRGSVSYHRDRRPSPRVQPRPGPATQPPAATSPNEHECKALRKQIAKKEKVIRTHRRNVAAHRRSADDITLSAFSRRKYEARMEEDAGWLAKAEADLEAFREARRREGIPPGCLR